MPTYKHTQIGYLMIAVTLLVLTLFVWMYLTAAAEPPSVDSGTNLLVTGVMTLIVCVLASFTTLTVSIDANRLRIKFGYGVFSKAFALDQVVSARTVKNRWYYGWGIRLWLWPYMWIYNISGFDAVEIVMKDGKIYRIGTDVPSELEAAIKQAVRTHHQ